MTITEQEVAQLKLAAEAAPEGPYTYGSKYVARPRHGSYRYMAQCPDGEEDTPEWERKAAFFAAASPDTVLRLIAELAAMRAAMESQAYCPTCQGSGENTMLDGAGPDAQEVDCNCQTCGGDGTLLGAYNVARNSLADAERKYLELCGKDVGRPDDIAVDRFATAMKTKMYQKWMEGRGGWDVEDQCSMADLARMLVDHVAKGDPVDIANFAMMLHQREAMAVEHHPCHGGDAKRAIIAASTRKST